MTCDYLPNGGAGAGTFGSVPFGSANPDAPTLEGAQQKAWNSMRATVGASTLGSPYLEDSALNPDNWALTALDPDAQPRLIQSVEVLQDNGDGTFDLEVFADGVLTPSRFYRLILLTPDTEDTGCFRVDFRSFDVATSSLSATNQGVTDDRIYDVANPQVARDAGGSPLGTYPITSAGDIGLDSGAAGLRKRILRRLTNRDGAFFHLPGYGLLDDRIDQKKLLTSDVAARIQAKARSQILREPDVTEVSVAVLVLPTAPNLISLAVRARSTTGISVDFVAPINPG